MQNRSKWLEQIDPDDSITHAARVTLNSRLATVVHFLDLAANHADKTPEHVHQLRVYTRRSLAALGMYENELGRKDAKWFRRRLHRIRKAAGEARDLDVFLLRYEKYHDDHQQVDHQRVFVRHVQKRRRKAQRPINKLYGKLIATQRFERHVRRLLKSHSTEKSAGRQPLGHWAQSRLAGTARKFFKAVPAQPRDLDALHRFRVRGKELRYTMELFSSVLPPQMRTSIYPQVSELQDRLGELNDHATACRRLEIWIAEADRDREADYLRGLISREQSELEASIARFDAWWTPRFADDLESSLRAVTAPTGAAPTGGK